MSTTFKPGTFTPAPKRTSAGAMLLAQGTMEAKLMLRHGEQQLLSVIIPLAILIAAAHLESVTKHGLHEVFPMVLAVAATSAGFTGQAISLAFDRRYGALKRTGASGVPAWAIIGGKILGVLTMVVFQILVLGIAAFILGLRISAGGVLLMLLSLFFGVAAFTAMGLLLGGTLSSEMVLALANLIWFVLLGVVGWTLYSQGLGDNGILNVVPTVALAGALTDASNSTFPGLELVSLAAWLAVAV